LTTMVRGQKSKAANGSVLAVRAHIEHVSSQFPIALSLHSSLGQEGPLAESTADGTTNAPVAAASLQISTSHGRFVPFRQYSASSHGSFPPCSGHSFASTRSGRLRIVGLEPIGCGHSKFIDRRENSRETTAAATATLDQIRPKAESIDPGLTAGKRSRAMNTHTHIH
jgi:hypothetical protein